MAVLSVGRCAWKLSEELSAKRGTEDRPYVFRCERCGFITAPTSFSDPTKIRGRRCRWFDPKAPGFAVHDDCWCHGLGDVVARGIDLATRRLPFRERILSWAGRLVDRLEARITLREEKAVVSDKKCKGCHARQLTLNARFPLLWLRKRICPPIVVRKEERGDPIPVCLVFAHGFGDAVQFTAVLRHLAKYRPSWRVSVYCKAGAHTLFRGKVDRVGVMDRDNLGKVYQEDFSLVHSVRWLEPDSTYVDSPATKVERSLREEFGITPDPELWGYHVEADAGDEQLADYALSQIADRQPDGRYNVVGIHYQGNSFRESKNFDECIIRNVVDQLKRRGLVPLIFDFEPGFRSDILREKTRGVRCFAHDHPLWKGLGVGDGSAMLSVIRRLRLFIGIDSGPEHLAAATDTPTIVLWGRGTHPVNYFAPAANVLHVIRKEQPRYILGDWEVGERYFQQNYRSHTLRHHVRIALPDLVDEELADARPDRARGVLGSREVRRG
jgi:ADP-heptose:LPS heptosyltransferase